MKVRLLQTIMEGGGIKGSARRGRVVAFVEGAVIDVSDATGEKWVRRGVAEEVAAPADEPEDEPE